MEDVKAIGNLGKNNHDMIEFIILRRGKHEVIIVKTLDLKNVDFNLLKEIVGVEPWKARWKNKGTQEAWVGASKGHTIGRLERRCSDMMEAREE